jgi:hypothetical protein
MKISFLFTEAANLADVPVGGRFRSNFEVPDAAKSLADIQARTFAIAGIVAQLSWAHIHLTCAEIDLKNHYIQPTGLRPEYVRSLDRSVDTLVLYFIRDTQRAKNCKLVIYAPVEVPIYHPMGNYPTEPHPELKSFSKRLVALSDQLLLLLNADNPAQKWEVEGFRPWVAQQSELVDKRKWRELRSRGKET